MEPTLDQLATGIMHLGYEDPDTYPLSGVSFDVWKELQRRGHVARGPNGEQVLTAKGKKIFTAMEAGDDVPEFTCSAAD
jgi:hypothetical protein